MTQHDPTPQHDLDRWYREHYPRIRRMAARLLGDDAAAEDAAQEALVRAWNRRDVLDPADIGAWMWQVARNLCLDALRRRRRQVSIERLPDVHDPHADPTPGVETAEERRAVRLALGRLNIRHREALVLRDVEGIEYETLASRFGMSYGATRAMLMRARRALREQLATTMHGVAGVTAALRLRAARLARRLGGDGRTAQAVTPAGVQAVATVALASVLALAGSLPGPAPAPAPAPVASGPLPAATGVASLRPGVPVVEAEAGIASNEAPSARGVRAGIDRRSGEAHVGAGAGNPVTGEDEYAWVRVWRDQKEVPSTALDTLDSSSESACGAAPGPCDALDEQLRDIELGGNQ